LISCLYPNAGELWQTQGCRTLTPTIYQPNLLLSQTVRAASEIKSYDWSFYWPARRLGQGDNAMLKTIVSIALGAVLCLSPIVAVAQTGYGVKPGAPSTSSFDRSWNRANESKDQARAGAEYRRQQGANARAIIITPPITERAASA
jgi:hypothetical protein